MDYTLTAVCLHGVDRDSFASLWRRDVFCWVLNELLIHITLVSLQASLFNISSFHHPLLVIRVLSYLKIHPLSPFPIVLPMLPAFLILRF